VNNLDVKQANDRIEFEEFEALIGGTNFIKRVLERDTVIPQWDTFK